jgi:hypothetical protein
MTSVAFKTIETKRTTETVGENIRTNNTQSRIRRLWSWTASFKSWQRMLVWGLRNSYLKV